MSENLKDSEIKKNNDEIIEVTTNNDETEEDENNSVEPRYSISCNHLKQYGWSASKVFDQEIASIVKHYREKFTW